VIPRQLAIKLSWWSPIVLNTTAELSGVFYYLQNIQEYPDFLPKAKQLAQEYVDTAKQVGGSSRMILGLATTATSIYDKITFMARLEKIYEAERKPGWHTIPLRTLFSVRRSAW
jgi:hypothetical protein